METGQIERADDEQCSEHEAMLLVASETPALEFGDEHKPRGEHFETSGATS